MKTGVDIATAEWNIERMPHQGGHTKDYYNAVRQKLDVVFEAYQESGASWGSARIETELKGVVQQISR